MIEKSITLNQYQPPIIKKEFLYKNKDYIFNNCTLNAYFSDEEDIYYSRANGIELSIEAIYKVLDYFNSPFIVFRSNINLESGSSASIAIYEKKSKIINKNNENYEFPYYKRISKDDMDEKINAGAKISDFYGLQTQKAKPTLTPGQNVDDIDYIRKTTYYCNLSSTDYINIGFDKKDGYDDNPRETNPDNIYNNEREGENTNDYFPPKIIINDSEQTFNESLFDENSVVKITENSEIALDKYVKVGSNSIWLDNVNNKKYEYYSIFLYNTAKERKDKAKLLYDLIVSDDSANLNNNFSVNWPVYEYNDTHVIANTAGTTLPKHNEKLENIPTNLSIDKRKRIIYIFNYLNYCLSKGRNGYYFPTLDEYRLRINEKRDNYTLKLIGNFNNLSQEIINKIYIKIYKYNSYQAILNKEYNIKEFLDKTQDNIFSDFLKNENYNLQINKTYKIILEIEYKSGEKTKTNFGIIKCLNFQNNPSININNFPNFQITSFDETPTYIKKSLYKLNNINFRSISNNDLININDKYTYIDFNKIQKKYLYYKNSELNPYISDSEGINPQYIDTINASTTFYWYDKLESLESINNKNNTNYNCYLLNNTRYWIFDDFSCMVPVQSTSYSYANKSLLIPRDYFDPNRENTFFNFSINQIKTYEREGDDFSNFCTPWIRINGLHKLTNEIQELLDLSQKDFLKQSNVFQQKYMMDRLSLCLNQNLQEYLGELNFDSQSSLTVNSIPFTSGVFKKQPTEKNIFQVGRFKNNSSFIVIKENENGNYKYYPLIKNNNITLDQDNAIVVTTSLGGFSPVEFFPCGLLINGSKYVQTNPFYTMHPKIIDINNQDLTYNENTRLSLDFSLSPEDDYIIINYFTKNVDRFDYSEEETTNLYNEKNLELIKSIRIIPLQENIIDSTSYQLSTTPIPYYEYQDKINLTNDEVIKYSVSAIFSDGNEIQLKDNNGNTIIDIPTNYIEEADDLINETDALNFNINFNNEEGYCLLTISQNGISNIQNYQFKIGRQEENGLNIEIIGIISGESLYELDSNQFFKKYYIKDYNIKQGKNYIYSIIPIKNNIQYNPIITKNQYCDFEDIFLTDEEDNFSIKFNPKISTYKTVNSISKVDTLGAQYPYIRENGNIKYKQMQLSGLISLDALNSEISNQVRTQTWANDNFLIKDKFLLEREYKNKILDWLNNGKYKLLKTPAEGNFIVSLMNVSLTPIDSLGRLLHSFSCDAYEIMDCTQENLNNYLLFDQRYIKLQ